MTSTENSMLTMKIIKLLGIAGIAVLVASYMAARVQRRDEEERRPPQRTASRRSVGRVRVARAAPGPRRRAPLPRTETQGRRPERWDHAGPGEFMWRP